MKNLIYLLITFTILSCSNEENKIPDDFDFGTTENGLYKNDYFDLEITFNPDWAVQNKQVMNDLVKANTERIVGENSSLEAAIKAAEVNTAYLLT
ncbi:MAG: hypothetical protein MK066_14240, partial [Crocinitomicaceae bacterium]|nr:hypothetical protein [Crocinitomicaceae bacterium]